MQAFLLQYRFVFSGGKWLIISIIDRYSIVAIWYLLHEQDSLYPIEFIHLDNNPFVSPVMRAIVQRFHFLYLQFHHILNLIRNDFHLNPSFI